MLISSAIERVHQYSSTCIPNQCTMRIQDLVPNLTKHLRSFPPIFSRLSIFYVKLRKNWSTHLVKASSFIHSLYVCIYAIGCTWNLLLLGIRKGRRRFGIPLVPVSAERGYHVKAHPSETRFSAVIAYLGSVRSHAIE